MQCRKCPKAVISMLASEEKLRKRSRSIPTVGAARRWVLCRVGIPQICMSSLALCIRVNDFAAWSGAGRLEGHARIADAQGRNDSALFPLLKAAL